MRALWSLGARIRTAPTKCPTLTQDIPKKPRRIGRLHNLKNPTTFNEKVTYKILYDRRPILTRLTDKLQAKDYVAERIGPDYLTEVRRDRLAKAAAPLRDQDEPRMRHEHVRHGLDPFHPPEFDEILGRMWRVPSRYE